MRLLVEKVKNLLPQGKATSVYHLVDQPDDPNEAMFDGAFTDNVKTALRHFPFVLVGAAGHARSTIAHLSKMGPYVHIGHANYEVNISSSSSEMVAFATSARAIFRSEADEAERSRGEGILLSYEKAAQTSQLAEHFNLSHWPSAVVIESVGRRIRHLAHSPQIPLHSPPHTHSIVFLVIQPCWREAMLRSFQPPGPEAGR